MDGPWSHYAKEDKSERERQKLCGLSHVWNQEAELVETKSRIVVFREWEVGEMKKYWSDGISLHLESE